MPSNFAERNTLLEMNPTLVEKVVVPPRLLSVQFINNWADRLYPLPGMDYGRTRAIANYVEAVGRLTLKSEQLANTAGFFTTMTMRSIPPAHHQHEVFDLYESYFQGLYKTLSTLAAVTVRFQTVYGDLKVRSMKKFLDAVAGKYPDTKAACELLELARLYRTHLDHPAGDAVSNWLSFRTEDGRGLRILFYGYKSNSGGIPKGAELVTFPFPTDADWVYDAPFVPYANQALRDLTEALFSELEHQEF